MFNFILNQYCDWNCDYCGITNAHKETTIPILKKHLPYIKDIYKKIAGELDMKLMIQGGEVGFMNPETLEYLFDYWDDGILVSTNGAMFQEKFKHLPVLDYLYHVVPDTTPKIIDLTNVPNGVNIGICCSSKNPKQISDFIKSNSHVIFNFVDFENPIGIKCNINEFNLEELYNLIKNLPNLTEYAKTRLKERIEIKTKLSLKQKVCKSAHNVTMIDFVNERIILCTRNFNKAFIPLNKENLIKVITEMNVFGEFETNCDSCYRMCQESDVLKSYKQKKEYKCLLI